MSHQQDHPDCYDEHGRLLFNAELLIHDEDYMVVDANWLDDMWIRGGSQFTWDKQAQQQPFVFEWNFRQSALSTTNLQVRFVGATDDFPESWAVYANQTLLKSNPTRGDIRNLLEIMK